MDSLSTHLRYIDTYVDTPDSSCTSVSEQPPTATAVYFMTPTCTHQTLKIRQTFGRRDASTVVMFACFGSARRETTRMCSYASQPAPAFFLCAVPPPLLLLVIKSHILCHKSALSTEQSRDTVVTTAV